MRKFISEIVADTVKLICRVNSPYSIKEMTEKRCVGIINAASVGDIILIRTKGEFTTALQPDYWTHSMVYLGTNFVIEATTKDVKLTNIMYALARTDDAILLRPKFRFDEVDMTKYAISRVNAPYDFSFDSSDKAFYCHELVAKVFMNSSSITIPKVKTLLGEKWLPKSFLDSGLFSKII